MEINHYGDTILGVVLTEDAVEGRMVLLTSHTFDNDFGSQTDLPGVKLPDDATEAGLARYCLSWEKNNNSLPIYQPNPSLPNYSMRYGFDQATNMPFNPTLVYLAHPSVIDACLTIPSGSSALAFGEGIYTVLSGCYIYSANLAVPGATLDVANTDEDGASDAGKLMYGTTAPVAQTIRYNSTTGALTFKVLH